MRKFPVIIFILFYCVGTLLFPLGDFSRNRNIAAMYEQCRGEDPDINPLDFVFEHLLNLGSVFEHFENEPEEENERPHGSDMQLQSVSQTLVIVAKPVQFEVAYAPFTAAEKKIHLSRYAPYLPHGFLSEVFHPPSV